MEKMEKGVESGEFKGERSRKFLKASKIVMEYQKQHYQEVIKRASQGEPVIWTNVGVPYEIMYAMDLPILFTLHWSALLAAKQMAPHYLSVLNERGYFRDLCRYCSMPLGYLFENKPEDGPWEGLPIPAALVVETMDDPILKIWELMAKKLKVPLYIWDHTMNVEPPRAFWESVENIEAYSYKEGWRVDYAVKETEGLINFLETVTGKR